LSKHGKVGFDAVDVLFEEVSIGIPTRMRPKLVGKCAKLRGSLPAEPLEQGIEKFVILSPGHPGLLGSEQLPGPLGLPKQQTVRKNDFSLVSGKDETAFVCRLRVVLVFVQNPIEA